MGQSRETIDLYNTGNISQIIPLSITYGLYFISHILFWSDTYSWKEQLEKTRNWKVPNEIGKNEVGKLEPNLKIFNFSLFPQLHVFQ